MRGRGPGSVWVDPHETLTRLAWTLSRRVQAPVLDLTGMEGTYDVTLEIPRGDTIFDAVERLGLKLVSKKVTVETLVVDQVEREPTAN